MFILVILIIAIVWVVWYFNKKQKEKNAAFILLKDQKLEELSKNNNEVKIFYFGENFAMYAQKGIPKLYVLDKKLNFAEYDLTKFDFFFDSYSSLHLMNKDESDENAYQTSKKIKYIYNYSKHHKYKKSHDVISSSELLSFADSSVKFINLNKEIHTLGKSFRYSDNLEFFAVDDTDTRNFCIYKSSALKGFSWFIGDEKKDYSVEKGRSGAGGAIAGGIAFGAVGAVIGGLTRRKQEETYVSAPYIDNACISLDVNQKKYDLFFISSRTENYQSSIIDLQNAVKTIKQIINHSNGIQHSSDPQIQKQMEVLDEMLSKGSIDEEYYNLRQSELMGI